jgi:hypothetical protein
VKYEQNKEEFKEELLNIVHALKEHLNPIHYGGIALGAGLGGVLGANVLRSDEEEDEDRLSLCGGINGAIAGAGLGYGAGAVTNGYLLEKYPDLEQAFERGFLKRASEHGFSVREAVELLNNETPVLPLSGAIGGGIYGYKAVPKKKDEKLSRKFKRAFSAVGGAALGYSITKLLRKVLKVSLEQKKK